MWDGLTFIGDLARDLVPATETGIVTATSDHDHHGRDAQSGRNRLPYLRSGSHESIHSLRTHLRKEAPATR